jgi:hypothetical protein
VIEALAEFAAFYDLIGESFPNREPSVRGLGKQPLKKVVL